MIKVNKNNCLALKFPKIAKEWNFSKNKNITPLDISYGSQRRVWWKCKNGHEWYVSVGSRTFRNRQCPYCSHQRVYREISLGFLKPELAKQWHPIKNGKLTPFDIPSGSSKKVWWQCLICKNEWRSSINGRFHHKSCPFCDGKRVNNTNSLLIKNPDLIKEWVFEKNDISPDKVTDNSGRKMWWKCKNGHEWQASIRARNHGSACPYCCSRYVCKDNCLSTMSPRLAKEWHPTKNGELTPIEVTSGSKTRVWWRCKNGHEWEATVNNRFNQRQNCPYCCGLKTCQDNCLAVINPDLCKEWNYKKNDPITPHNISPHNSKKVWWKCKNGHEFLATVGSRSYGSGCPKCFGAVLKDGTHCLSLLEAYFYLKYKDIGVTFFHNKNYPKSRYRYDFYFPGDNKYVEVTRYDRIVCRWWKQYSNKILKKKNYVENNLNANFEFIQKTLSKSETKWVKSFIK